MQHKPSIPFTPKLEPLAVYAYGVAPSRDMAHMDTAGVFTPLPTLTGFLHYWIDANLEYHERASDSAQLPDLNFISNTALQVTLRGPRDFTIQSKR